MACDIMPTRAKLIRNSAGMGARALCSLGMVLLLPGCLWHHHHRDEATEYQATRVARYQERYHNPLLSPGAQFATLPPAVQRTVRAEAGAADIDDIVKDNDAGRIVYRVYFRNAGANPPLYIAPDGSLLYPDLRVAIGGSQDTVGVLTGGPVTGITLSDLPPQVVKKIQERAPDAEVAYISKETRGDKVVYTIVFKDQMHPALRINANGTVVSDSGREK